MMANLHTIKQVAIRNTRANNDSKIENTIDGADGLR